MGFGDEEECMNLNKRQKIIVWSGLLLFIACFAVPPWEQHYDSDATEMTRFFGYRLYTNPPEAPPGSYWTVRLAMDRLLIQWGVVAVATIGTALLLKGGKSETPDKSEEAKERRA